MNAPRFGKPWPTPEPCHFHSGTLADEGCRPLVERWFAGGSFED